MVDEVRKVVHEMVGRTVDRDLMREIEDRLMYAIGRAAPRDTSASDAIDDLLWDVKALLIEQIPGAMTALEAHRLGLRRMRKAWAAPGDYVELFGLSTWGCLIVRAFIEWQPAGLLPIPFEDGGWLPYDLHGED